MINGPAHLSARLLDAKNLEKHVGQLLKAKGFAITDWMVRGRCSGHLIVKAYDRTKPELKNRLLAI